MEKESNKGAGRKFNVSESSVRDWRKQKDKLLLLPASKKQLPGGGRKPLLPDFEGQLAEWIEELRGQHLWVTRSEIQHKATQLYQGSDFTASRGWLEKFMKRFNFSLRRKTSVSQKLPQDLLEKVSTFILRVTPISLILHWQYGRNTTLARHYCV